MTRFVLYTFDELGVDLLYRVLKSREEIFVVEQECAYLEVDGHDPAAWHVLGFDVDDELIAYARVLPAGTTHADHPSVGRVIVVESARGRGVARALMERALAHARDMFGDATLKISAQTYLEGFYASLGFRTVGDGYLEDGIPHVAMLRATRATDVEERDA